MRQGKIYIYYGDGKGKTTLAIGQGIRAIGEELSVIMIQFLDYNNTKEIIPLKKLEPDFNVFRFEKMRTGIDDLDESGKKELENELNTAFNFSRKVFETGECDVLILDGITEAVDKGFISEEDLCEILDKKPQYMDVILTGRNVYGCLVEKADNVYCIKTEKISNE